MEGMHRLRVLGAGDNVVDRYVHTKMMYPGGNALNFSVYAKQLGTEAGYMGVFGDDAAAVHIQEVLTEIGIDFTYSRHVSGENGYAQVDLINGDRVFTGGNKGGVQNQHPLRFTPEDLNYMKQFDLIHSSCYSDLTPEELHKIQQTNIPLSYDFSGEWDETQLALRCPYITYSLLSCGHLDDQEIIDALMKAHQYGSKIVLATMGKRGAILFDGKRFFHQGPYPVTPVDTLGAGDAFFTAFLVHYLLGQKSATAIEPDTLLKTSLARAARFAADTCLVDGAFGYGITFYIEDDQPNGR